jgi:tryptophan-rich sensory protein
MTFDNSDVVSLVAWMTFIVFEMHAMSQKDVTWYRDNAKRIPYSLPSWVFPIVWTILKGLLIASNYLFFKYSVSSTHWSFVAVFVLTVVNIVLAKTWSVVFWSARHEERSRRLGMAWIIAMFIFATAVVVLVMMGVAAEQNMNGSYLPMGLYIAYTVWLLIAVGLNGAWYYYYYNGSGTGTPWRMKNAVGSPLADPLSAAEDGTRIRHRTN